jgi:hypothetical protein
MNNIALVSGPGKSTSQSRPPSVARRRYIRRPIYRRARLHLAALVYNAFVGVSFHQLGYNHVEKHVGEEQLKELQRRALSAVKAKHGKWWEEWRKRAGDQGNGTQVSQGGEGRGVCGGGAHFDVLCAGGDCLVVARLDLKYYDGQHGSY